MRIRSPKDFWSGLIFVAIGAAFIVLAQDHRMGNLHRIGPGLFPTLVGALLAGLGLVVMLRALVLAGEPVPRFRARPITGSLIAIILFGVLLRWLGMVAAVATLVLVGAFASREVRLLETVVLAGAMILFSVGVFVWLLGLPLPLWPTS